MSPPASYIAEPPGEQITGPSESELGTRSGQERYLVRELDVTYPQAKALLRAYALDERDRRSRQASALTFGNWLRSNYWACVDPRRLAS